MHKILTLAAAVMLGYAFSTLSAAAQTKSSSGESFEVWIEGVRAEARRLGYGSQAVVAALQDARFIQKVVKLDRRQPSRIFTMQEYLDRIVTKDRVSRGAELLRKHKPLLKRVAAKYRVQPRFIVALWGIETNYGRITGGYSVISALATLAYDGRRAAFFRKELLNALRILNEGHIAPGRMLGSWAGAMGQSQFMPSSFLRYAVDYNGDGKRDIWSTLDDVFASAANYLAKAGWKDDRTWGREVRLPRRFNPKLADLKVQKRLSQWQRLGVRRADGRDLPTRDLMASVVWKNPELNGPAFVVYSNYRSLLRWNRSHHFAVSVGLVSDRIAGR